MAGEPPFTECAEQHVPYFHVISCCFALSLVLVSVIVASSTVSMCFTCQGTKLGSPVPLVVAQTHKPGRIELH